MKRAAEALLRAAADGRMAEDALRSALEAEGFRPGPDMVRLLVDGSAAQRFSFDGTTVVLQSTEA